MLRFADSLNYQPSTTCSLPLVFALAGFLEDGEAGFLRVGYRERLEFGGRAEGGDDLAHGFLARWTMRKRLRGQGPVQGEFAAADFAVTFAEFVFVKRHALINRKILERHIEGKSPCDIATDHTFFLNLSSQGISANDFSIFRLSHSRKPIQSALGSRRNGRP